MPAYDYTCARCGQTTEVLHGIHASGPTVCPKCGAEGTMRKGITAAAIHFKGSGWAKKDRSASKSGATKAKPAADGDSGSGSGSGTDGTSGGSSKDGASGEGSGARKTPAVTSGPPASSAGATAGGD